MRLEVLIKMKLSSFFDFVALNFADKICEIRDEDGLGPTKSVNLFIAKLMW